MTTSIHVHLQVYAEVVDGARTVLAPLGLPAVLKRHCPAPLLLVPMRVWDVYVVVVGRFGRSIKRGPNQSRPPPRTPIPIPTQKGAAPPDVRLVVGRGLRSGVCAGALRR